MKQSRSEFDHLILTATPEHPLIFKRVPGITLLPSRGVPEYQLPILTKNYSTLKRGGRSTSETWGHQHP